jgi:hypothetical protein
MKDMHDRHLQEFYADVCAYVRGEPNAIRPGTVGEIQAKIAKNWSSKMRRSSVTKTSSLPRSMLFMMGTMPLSQPSAQRIRPWQKC